MATIAMAGMIMFGVVHRVESSMPSTMIHDIMSG